MENIKKELWSWDHDEIKEYNDEDILKEFLCKTCYDFSAKPKVCYKCKYLMCLKCIENIQNITTQKKCPHCIEDINKYEEIDNNQKKFMNSIKVVCINSENGCKIVRKLCELEVHLKNNCEFLKNKNNKFIVKNLYNYNQIPDPNPFGEINQFNDEIKYPVDFINNFDLKDFDLFNEQKTKFNKLDHFLIIKVPKIDNLNKPNLCYRNQTNLKKSKPILKKIENHHNMSLIKKVYNEGEYKGALKNNKKDGYGKLIYANKDYYEGYWMDDEKHGYGVYKFNNGLFYIGDWNKNKKSGYGKEMYRENEFYRGIFNEGKRNGIGFYHYENNDSYEGNWNNGKKNGRGILKYNNGTVYNGEFINDLKSGYGIEAYIENKNNKKIYRGYFKNNQKDGLGYFYNNQRDESGNISSNSFIYYGNWKNGKKHGYGILFDSNYGDDIFKLSEENNQPKNSKVGFFYEGFFENDQKSGKGIEIKSYCIYIGEFKNNLRNGLGTCFLLSGFKIIGNWLNDKQHGEIFSNYYDLDTKKIVTIKEKWENGINQTKN